MSIKNIKTFEQLVKAHEAELKDFHAAALAKWQQFRAEEDIELLPYRGEMLEAPIALQKQLANKWAAFQDEWGSKGTIIQHIKDRQRQELNEFIRNKTHSIGINKEQER